MVILAVRDQTNNTDLLYEIDERGERVLVRSIESNQSAYLRFTNKTTRTVDIWWRGFRGLKHHYVRLEAGSYYDVNSYISHPWEFSDAHTRERYVINNNPIYRAPQNIAGMMFRTNWNITISVRSLRSTAMLKIAETLITPDAVDELLLPRMVAQDLKKLVTDIRRPLTPPRRD